MIHLVFLVEPLWRALHTLASTQLIIVISGSLGGGGGESGHPTELIWTARWASDFSHSGLLFCFCIIGV